MTYNFLISTLRNHTTRSLTPLMPWRAWTCGQVQPAHGPGQRESNTVCKDGRTVGFVSHRPLRSSFSTSTRFTCPISGYVREQRSLNGTAFSTTASDEVKQTSVLSDGVKLPIPYSELSIGQ